MTTIPAPSASARRTRTDPLPASRQESILAALCFDDETGAKIAQQVCAEHFEGELRDIAAAALAFREKYGSAPGEAHLNEIALPDKKGHDQRRKYLARLALLIADVNLAFVADCVSEFMREQALKVAVLEASERFLSGPEEGLAGDVERILQSALDAMPGTSGKTSGMTVQEFNAQPVPGVTPMLTPWLNRGNIFFLHGREGTLKTRLAMHVAECLADCRPCLDGRWLPSRPWRVLFVDGEMSLPQMVGITRRLAVRRVRNLHVLSKLGAEAEGNPVPLLFTREGRARIDREIEQTRPDLVVLDSVFTLFGAVSERELEKWNEVNPWLKAHKIAQRSVLIIDHEAKGRGGTMYGSVIKGILSDGYMGVEKVRSDDPEETAVDLSFNKPREFGGPAARPFRIFFRKEPSGCATWRTEEKRDDERAETKSARVAEMLRAGSTAAEIIAETGASKGLVSQVRKKIREGGLV